MITAKEIEQVTMSDEKKKQAKNDYIAFYVGRKLSYFCTIPFLYTNIKPDTISKISMIPVVIGFFLCCLAKSKVGLLMACLFFFFQDMLDGVDGNVARYRKQYSKYGSVWDAMSGYLIGCLSFMGTGVATAHFGGILDSWLAINHEIYFVLGGITGMATVFPRLIMHKTITTVGKTESIDAVKNKGEFSFIRILALNLASSAGGLQVLRIVAVVFNMLDLFTILYFLFFMGMAVISIYYILRES